MRWSKVTGIGIGIAATAYLVWQGITNTQRLAFEHHCITIPDLPPAFDGFRVMHLADLHLRRYSTIGDSLLAVIEEINPDIVCMTGDYLYTAMSLPELEDFFFGLSQRPAVVGVFGNADYRPGITDAVRADWARFFPFLINSALCLSRGEDSLWIAGVDDPHRWRDSVPDAMAMMPEDAVAILLAHSPEVVLRPLDPRIRLILTGHTHGGQICLPGGVPLYNNARVPAALTSGLHQLPQAQLYVSRGIGATRLPLRFGASPEITLFTLTRPTVEDGKPARRRAPRG